MPNVPCIRASALVNRLAAVLLTTAGVAGLVLALPATAQGRGDRPGNADGASVECASDDRRHVECPLESRGRPRLLQQISGTACVEGKTWGSKPGAVWVGGGCRGRFGGTDTAERPKRLDRDDYSVTCSSAKGRYQACSWDARYGQPQLKEKLSGKACTFGQSWGYDRRQGLWVDGGCRARFGPR